MIAARFYPFPEAPRFPSGTSTLANGGREEVFYVRLPDDRLGAARSAATAAFPQPAFAPDGEDKIVAELFRIRDADSQVIGLASRLTGKVASRGDAPADLEDWMLLIPGRGTLLMSNKSLPAEVLPDLSTGRMGFTEAESGLMVKGTEEFAELTGFYKVTTDIESMDNSGVAHGLITLTTRLRGLGR